MNVLTYIITLLYSWNTAKVRVKDQSHNQLTYLTTVGNDSMVSNIRAAQPAAKHNLVAIAKTLMISPLAGMSDQKRQLDNLLHVSSTITKART